MKYFSPAVGPLADWGIGHPNDGGSEKIGRIGMMGTIVAAEEGQPLVVL
jgi:hypothetical protein